MGVPDGAREALIDGLKRIELRPVNLQGRGRVISADHMADALLTALSAAGYVVIKPDHEEHGIGAGDQVVPLIVGSKWDATHRRVVGPWVPVSGEENKDG